MNAILPLGATLTLAASLTASAVSVGQIDNFEDGTTQNWTAGLLGAPHPAPPVNVASGGPGGAGDNFLRLTSVGGGGPGSRLSAINFNGQWSGDYIGAGVASISMDLRNLGDSDLFLRLVLSDPVAGPPANMAFSTTPVFLPAGSGWTSVVFPLGISDLGTGLGDIETALRNTTELRIYHSQAANAPNPVAPIAPILAQLGVDNIQARGGAVPEAGSSALLLGLAGIALAGLRRMGGVRAISVP